MNKKGANLILLFSLILLLNFYIINASEKCDENADCGPCGKCNLASGACGGITSFDCGQASDGCRLFDCGLVPSSRGNYYNYYGDCGFCARGRGYTYCETPEFKATLPQSHSPECYAPNSLDIAPFPVRWPDASQITVGGKWTCEFNNGIFCGEYYQYCYNGICETGKKCVNNNDCGNCGVCSLGSCIKAGECNDGNSEGKPCAICTHFSSEFQGGKFNCIPQDSECDSCGTCEGVGGRYSCKEKEKIYPEHSCNLCDECIQQGTSGYYTYKCIPRPNPCGVECGKCENEAYNENGGCTTDDPRNGLDCQYCSCNQNSCVKQIEPIFTPCDFNGNKIPGDGFCIFSTDLNLVACMINPLGEEKPAANQLATNFFANNGPGAAQEIFDGLTILYS